MLIFNNKAQLVASTDDEALEILGYPSVEEFFQTHDDLSSIFIQKRGYIASYEGVNWVAFVLNDILPQKKVLVNVDGSPTEFEIVGTKLYSNAMDSVSIEFVKSGEVPMPQEEDATPVAPTQDPSSQHDENDELMELLNLDDTTPAIEETQKPKEQPQEAPSSSDDLDDFELDLDFDVAEEKEEPKEQPATPKVDEQQDSDLDDLYDLNLDFEDKEDQPAKDKTAQQPPQDSTQEDKTVDEIEGLDLDLDFDSQETKEQETEQKPQEMQQYIDQQHNDSAKEVDLETLSNELGLEEQESANFILDFTNMVKAKQEQLSGENASIEAASLKNIAENFRLFNIVKTLETIEDGEPNASLLFSQIDQLQKQLEQYTKDSPQPKLSNIAWHDVKKQKIEFDPNVAAESLGLPTDLISEFVGDFMEQAKESQDLFDEAYANKDLSTIQENAHKLKGAAANLRIDKVAKVLEELQHNEDLDKVPGLLEEFWSMYLGLQEVV
ncbi:MAG: Hpt domain-containing protein [Campylobacterota bacterium]